VQHVVPNEQQSNRPGMTRDLDRRLNDEVISITVQTRHLVCDDDRFARRRPVFLVD
jgi:hypothetical protein